MASIASLDALVNRLSGGNSGTPNTLAFFKGPNVDGAAATAPVFGRWTSLWRYGGNPSAGSAAGSTLALVDNTTSGALKQPSAGGGRHQFMTGAGWNCTQSGALLIYDRQEQAGGFSGTVTTAQVPTDADLTIRYASATEGVFDSCFGNHLFVEIESLIGTTATTATINYTDQSDTTQTTPPFTIGGTGLREAQRLIPVPLVPGTGVTKILNIDLVASTGTAGNIAVVIARPLVCIPLYSAGTPHVVDLALNDPAISRVLDGACLALAYFASGTTQAELHGFVQLVES